MKEMNDWFKQLPVEPIKGACYPLGLWKNGALFTESDDGRLLLYDPAIQEVRDLGIAFSREQPHLKIVFIATRKV